MPLEETLGNHPKKPASGLNGLLCPDTLRSALREAERADLRAREGLKELLSPSPTPAPILAVEESPKTREDLDLWDRCLALIAEDFLNRKNDILKLNKARRDQIENFVKQHSSAKTQLEDALTSRLGSAENEALKLFAYQIAIFHFLQLLLVKRWVDMGLLPEETLSNHQQTLNWQITTYLKRNNPKRIFGKNDWSFLKQNIFSWYSPTKETGDRLRLIIATTNVSQETNDFPIRVLDNLGKRTRISLLGFSPNLIDARSLWTLLLAQKSHDLRLDSHQDLELPDAPILMSGLWNGDCLNALKDLSRGKEMQNTWAFTDNDLERFLSEILLLWASPTAVPTVNIHSRTLLSALQNKNVPLFQDGTRLPHQAQLAACFPDPQAKELEDAARFIPQLKENALILIASNSFWPSEQTATAHRLRDETLKYTSIRLILDMRQLSSTSGDPLPKGVFILEKCSSKEIRDSNRPQIVRVKGRVSPSQLPEVWSLLLENIRHEMIPGDLITKSLGSLGDSVRIESMSAAASQQQLKNAPWLTLSDPVFYEISGRMRRSPSKAYSIGSILKWKSDTAAPSARAILLQEHPTQGIQATPPAMAHTLDGNGPQHMFIPESAVVEDSGFFVAQILSAPVQFWYHLEMEHNQNAKSHRTTNRQSEQRLKLMPLVRLFDPGTLLPITPSTKRFESLESLKKEIGQVFRAGLYNLQEKIRLHQAVVSLNHSINQNAEVCSEFSKHLFPSLQISRNNPPNTLPEISPQIAFEIFKHLDKTPLIHHPAVHMAKLRPVHDFKLTSCEYTELPLGGLAELRVFHGIDAILKFSGPALILKAAADEIHKKSGRPMQEVLGKMYFPTDFMLLQTQLKEVLGTIHKQLQSLKDQVALMDQIFCTLFGLTTNFENEEARMTIRRHLSPEEGKIAVQFAKNSPTSFIQADSGPATGFLQ